MKKRRLTVLVFVVLSACATTACGSSSTAPTNASISSISVSAASVLTFPGQTSTLAAVANRSDFTTSIITQLVAWQSSNTAVVTVGPTGLATAVAPGSAVVTATYQGLLGTLNVTVTPQLDCETYDPSQLQIQQGGGDFSLVGPFSVGLEVYARFDNATDAANGLALYQRYTSICYVGRSNSRSNRSAYVSGYWVGLSGRSTTIQPEDCEPYDPGALHVVNAGAIGWTLTASGRQLLLLDSAADASTMLSVARANTNQCFIGRGNTRSNASVYITQYWK